jgi:hypothetical protein
MTDIEKELVAALELALRYHGVTFLSDPPQDAWKAMNVEPVARAAIARAAIARAKQQAEPVSALTRYNEIVAEDPAVDMGGALERLRFFCSLSMPGQDWLDVEPFFDAVEKEQAEPVAYCYVRKGTSADAFTFDPNPADAVEGTVFPLYAHPTQQAEPAVVQADKFCDSHCTMLDHHADCQYGNPSF